MFLGKCGTSFTFAGDQSVAEDRVELCGVVHAFHEGFVVFQNGAGDHGIHDHYRGGGPNPTHDEHIAVLFLGVHQEGEERAEIVRNER
jgi:hypothetical protein